MRELVFTDRFHSVKITLAVLTQLGKYIYMDLFYV